MDRLMDRLVRSRFLRVDERDGLVVAVHQLHPDPLFTTSRTWSQLETWFATGAAATELRALIEELEQRQLVVSASADDEKALHEARAAQLHRLMRPTILYLMMAQGCNWKCDSCPIPGLAIRHGEHRLGFEEATAGLRLWMEHIRAYGEDDDPYYIIFYGGEPLLNRQTLEQLLDHLESLRGTAALPKRVELMLCTNGQLLDEELAVRLRQSGVTVALGLDGPGSVNDHTRRTAQNGVTAEVIAEAMARLSRYEVPVVVSTTMTPENLSTLPALRSALEAMGVNGFGLNLLKGEAVKRLSTEERDAYARNAAHLVIDGLVSPNHAFYEYQLQKRLQALRAGWPGAVDCTCYGNQLVVQADGQVGHCPFQRHDYGHVLSLTPDFRISNTPQVQTLRSRLPIFRPEVAAGSFAGVLHGGGCAWNSTEVYGDELAEDHCNALFAQEVHRELIWSLLPADRASALRRGEVSAWSDRRLRPL